jgi:glycosyltransferase involved in cell wall biosynthesis
MTQRFSLTPLPHITIITPAFSGDEYLEATIRSVIYQDYPNLEYIAIDDGTRADRRRILEKYESELCWQTCPPGTELNAGLNMAFAKSSGEILGWLEPGDLLHTNGL